MPDADTRFAIIDVYHRYAEGLDTKNWDMVRACFADEVLIDYGEVSGGPDAANQPRSADDWIPVLQSVIMGFDFTQHTMSNFRFRQLGERVECAAYLIADHVMLADPAFTVAADDEIATVMGEYVNVLERAGDAWKIIDSKLDMKWSRGNAMLFPRAMERAAARM